MERHSRTFAFPQAGTDLNELGYSRDFESFTKEP
jgi:hypothetical protein